MRVLMVLDSLSFGGAENLVAGLARVAPRFDLDVDVVGLAPPTKGRGAWEDVLRSAGVHPRYLSISRVTQPDAVARIASAVRASRCDVVHAHLGTAATLAPPAARLTGRFSLCTFHHVPMREWTRRDALRERLSVAVASRSNGAVFVSEAAREAFAARYRPNPRTWAVLRNGVDLQLYRPGPGPLPPDLGIPSGVPVVTLVAALRGPKGQDHAILSWPRVLRAAPDARLLLVGSGDRETRLRSLVAESGLRDRVVFAGIRTDVEAILRGSTLALLPSSREALPTALIEAAACGLAAVAYRTGGVPEVVQDGETGLLVPAGDIAGLADAVTALLLDAPRRAVMGAAARRQAETRFDMDSWCGRLRQMYEVVASGRPVTAAGMDGE